MEGGEAAFDRQLPNINGAEIAQIVYSLHVSRAKFRYELSVTN